MSIPLWGQLQRSQDDPSTIEDFVAAQIVAHDNDSTAHLLPGASLAAHKAFDVIDHPAGSIVGDKFSRLRTITINFESLDALLTFGNVFPGIGDVLIRTDSTINENAGILAVPALGNPLDWSKDMYWRLNAQFIATTDQRIQIGAGVLETGDGTTGFGFRVVNGELFAYHARTVGGEVVFTSLPIDGITLTNTNVYEVVYVAADPSLTFFINGQQVAQFTNGLPTGAEDQVLSIYLITLTNASRTMYAGDYFFQTEF